MMNKLTSAWRKLTKKKKRRGMFDPLGYLETVVTVEGKHLGQTHRVTRWVKFYSDTKDNKKMCVEHSTDDGVWIGRTFYPARRIKSVFMTGEKKLEEYDV